MTHKQKKLGIIIAISLVAIVILTFVINTIIENKIASAINDLPESVQINYTSIEVNVWTGNLEVLTPNISVKGKTTKETILNATLKSIEINDIGYWDYLVNDKITVENFVINQIVAKYKHNPLVKNDDYQSGFLDQLKQIINFKNITVINSDLLISDYETDSTILSVPQFNLELKNLQIDAKASKIDKKFKYEDFEITAKNLKWATNEYDDLFADSIQIANKNATLNGLKFQTKYTKAEYSKILKTERDHFNLLIKEVNINDMNFGFNDLEQFYFKSEKVLINEPYAAILRDKLVADDKTYKKLYGTLLRDLDIDLELKTVEIIQGKLSYLEKVKKDKQAGRIDFTAMNATITNLGNKFGDDATIINMNATFMKNSTIEVQWNFKVADTTDQFIFKADLGLLKMTQMNQFTEPNLNVGLNGELKQTYFTISGNPKMARIDIKMKYDDFDILVLRKNGNQRNKFLSTIINLFISEDSEDDKETFRYGQAENVERDATKSVFNFVWMNVRSGLLSVMAGDGKK